MLATKSPYIKSAYHQLQIISQDKEKRLEYEAREKAVRDHNQLMREAEERGEERGEKRGKEMIAKNMLNLGLSIDIVMQSTGLPKEQIEAFQKEQT